MKIFLFLLLFGLFEIAYANNPPSRRTILGVVKDACQRALGRAMGPVPADPVELVPASPVELVPANPLDELQLDLANKFAQYGHQVDDISNALKIHDDVHRKGLANVALALERGTPLVRHSKVISKIVIRDNGRGVDVWQNTFVSGLTVSISVYTPVEEIVPKINIALLEYEIKQKVHVYGPTSFSFERDSNVDDEKFVSFLETFLKALDDDKDAARIADFPDFWTLKIIDEKIPGTDFRSAAYNGRHIVVSADALAESLFHRLANALLEQQVTDKMWQHYSYIAGESGSAVINNGVDETAYEGVLKRILEWLDDPSLASRDAEDVLAKLGHIYVTENQLEIRPRQISHTQTVFDIYVPSNRTEMDKEIFTKTKLLPPAQ